MSYNVKDLQPGSLYITISVPGHELSAPPAAYHYPPYLLADFNPDLYEVSCPGAGPEEFNWGIYWHRGPDDGVWYTLDPVAAPAVPRNPYYSARRATLTHALSARAIDEGSHSPRLDPSVVALVRVLRAPAPLARDLSRYLGWLTAHVGEGAGRSFIWAATVYLRARAHVAGPRPQQAAAFDVESFLWEALELAYGEVWYALGGQLPRPILVSRFGVEVLAVEEEQQEETKGKGRGEADADEEVREMLLRRLGSDTDAVHWPPLQA